MLACRWSTAPSCVRGIFRRGIITGPRFTEIVQGLPSMVPFVAPEEIERSQGKPFAVRLGANELTFGPSPKAAAAMAEAASSVWKYGDPKSHELRLALAAHHSVEPNNIVVGEGVDGLLAYTTHLLIGPGDALVSGTYPNPTLTLALTITPALTPALTLTLTLTLTVTR